MVDFKHSFNGDGRGEGDGIFLLEGVLQVNFTFEGVHP